MRKLTKLSVIILTSLYILFDVILTTTIFVGVASGYYDGIYILGGVFTTIFLSAEIVPIYETLKETRF